MSETKPPPSPPPPRKPGRPKSAEPSIAVASWIPVRTFDDLAKYALHHDRSLSALIRESIQQRFPLK